MVACACFDKSIFLHAAMRIIQTIGSLVNTIKTNIPQAEKKLKKTNAKYPHCGFYLRVVNSLIERSNEDSYFLHRNHNKSYQHMVGGFYVIVAPKLTDFF